MPAPPAARAFLDVESSLGGRRWVGPDPATERRAEGLAQATALPLPVARILAERDVAAAEATGFLAPKLRDLLPDPRRLRDMEVAAARLNAAVAGLERIAIFADYDVDGGASAALLLDWLGQQGRPATLYIPDRIDEGYGPNPAAMAALSAGHELIVCVDCGTMAHEALAAADCDVIVLDHHLGGADLPRALAVVNPNRADESGDLGHLCAAGVVFLALVEANRQARAAARTDLPELMAMLDLVALATVADVAPLVGVNRAFVRQGLAVMAQRARPGLAALSDVARLDTAPTAFHLGHLLGPRINAGGRVGRADLGARCLAATGSTEAANLAGQLDALNTERRAIEASVREAALAQADARAGDSPGLAWAAGAGWHPGVVGIVAARLKEATNRPAVVIGIDGGIGKGSARSVPGVDLGRAVHRLADEGLLLKGGGHAMAAGLTIAEDQIEAAMARLSALLAPALAAAPGRGELRISGLLAGAPDRALWDMIDSAGPYGAAAPAPRFALPAMRLERVTPVGDGQHLRLSLRGAGDRQLAAMAWGAMSGPLGPALMAAGGRNLHIAGKLELSSWQGRETLRLRLDDAAPA